MGQEWQAEIALQREILVGLEEKIAVLRISLCAEDFGKLVEDSPNTERASPVLYEAVALFDTSQTIGDNWTGYNSDFTLLSYNNDKPPIDSTVDEAYQMKLSKYSKRIADYEASHGYYLHPQWSMLSAALLENIAGYLGMIS
jgi:hypothetical protein